MSDLPAVLPGSAAARLAHEIVTPQAQIDGDTKLDRRQGVITAINGSPPATVDVQLGGSSITIPSVQFLRSYSPVVGQSVWVDMKGSDPLVIGSNSTKASTDYTPDFTATVSAPTLGTGGAKYGRYVILQDKICWVEFLIQYGSSGTAPGSGIYAISLPFLARTPLSAVSLNIGMGTALDFGTTAYPVMLELATFNFLYVIMRRASDGNAIQHNVPVAWGVSADQFYGTLTYEMA